MREKSLVALLVVVVSALMLGGCAATQPTAQNKDDLLNNRAIMIADARSAVPQISIVQLKQMIDENEDFILIDVRDPNDWESGVVDYRNVATISRGMLEFLAPEHFAVNDPLFVMCKTGLRAALAAKALQDMGYSNVTGVAQGVDHWQEAGYPLKDNQI